MKDRMVSVISSGPGTAMVVLPGINSKGRRDSFTRHLFHIKKYGWTDVAGNSYTLNGGKGRIVGNINANGQAQQEKAKAT